MRRGVILISLVYSVGRVTIQHTVPGGVTRRNPFRITRVSEGHLEIVWDNFCGGKRVYRSVLFVKCSPVLTSMLRKSCGSRFVFTADTPLVHVLKAVGGQLRSVETKLFARVCACSSHLIVIFNPSISSTSSVRAHSSREVRALGSQTTRHRSCGGSMKNLFKSVYQLAPIQQGTFNENRGQV